MNQAKTRKLLPTLGALLATNCGSSESLRNLDHAKDHQQALRCTHQRREQPGRLWPRNALLRSAISARQSDQWFEPKPAGSAHPASPADKYGPSSDQKGIWRASRWRSPMEAETAIASGENDTECGRSIDRRNPLRHRPRPTLPGTAGSPVSDLRRYLNNIRDQRS